MTSIIIPVLNNKEITSQCIDSIQRKTENYELIIVDNSDDGSFYPISSFINITSWGNKAENFIDEKGTHLYIIRNHCNKGFPIAVNQGIEFSEEENICILNNDIVVTEHWLDYLLRHLESSDVVGPVTNSVSGIQQVQIDPYEDEDELDYAAEQYHNENNGQAIYYPRLVGFCMLIKKEVINKIGLFDEDFTPGNFEDDDFCLRAIEDNFKLGVAKDCYIHHFGSVTHDSLQLDYKQLIETNKKKFFTKWPEAKYQELIRKGFYGTDEIKFGFRT